MKKAILFSAVMIAALALGPAVSEAALSIGDDAPDFTAPWYTSSGATGESFSLSGDTAGKVVYMQFVTPKDVASHALMQLAQQEIYPRFAGNDDVVLLTIIAAYAPSFSKSDALALMQTTGFTYEALLDLDGSIFSAYKVDDSRQVYILDRSGVVKFAPTQPEGSALLIDALNDILDDVGDTLSVTTNQASYAAGDTVSIEVDVEKPVTEPFDAYCGIRLPDLSYLSIMLSGKLESGIHPLATNVPSLSAPRHYTLFQSIIPQGITPGSYLIRAVLVKPETGLVIAESNVVVEVR